MPLDLLEKGISKHSKPAKQALHHSLLRVCSGCLPHTTLRFLFHTYTRHQSYDSLRRHRHRFPISERYRDLLLPGHPMLGIFYGTHPSKLTERNHSLGTCYS